MLLWNFAFADYYESFYINSGETVIYNMTTLGFTLFELDSVGLMDIYLRFDNGRHPIITDSCLDTIYCAGHYKNTCGNELFTTITITSYVDGNNVKLYYSDGSNCVMRKIGLSVAACTVLLFIIGLLITFICKRYCPISNDP